jgi:hypothetical protein
MSDILFALDVMNGKDVPERFGLGF